jgi:6,7-dimethyl-8-ribityllumazine synthase
MKIGIVYSDYYKEVCDGLMQGVKDAAKGKDVDFIEFRAPGAFEIPLKIKQVSSDGSIDGFIALGCVVQGETHHHDLINFSVSKALMDLSLDLMKPVGFGILTTKNYEQALERSVGSKSKGSEVFCAVHEMLSA